MSGKVLTRNPVTGRVFPCCWDSCENPADARIEARVTDGVLTAEDGCHPLMVGTPKVLIYTFCRERCRDYWRNSHQDQGNLPHGVRGPLR